MKDQWLLLRWGFLFIFSKSKLQVTRFVKVPKYDLRYFNLINFQLIFHYFNPAIVSCILALLSPTLPIHKINKHIAQIKIFTFWKSQHFSMYQSMDYKIKISFISDVQELEWRPSPPRRLHQEKSGFSHFSSTIIQMYSDWKIHLEVFSNPKFLKIRGKILTLIS